ncbi:MAG: hypothetical protein WC654_03710 [Patescibacteria group bacterium]
MARTRRNRHNNTHPAMEVLPPETNHTVSGNGNGNGKTQALVPTGLFPALDVQLRDALGFNFSRAKSAVEGIINLSKQRADTLEEAQRKAETDLRATEDWRKSMGL